MKLKYGDYVRTKTGKILKVDIIEKCKICLQNEYVNIEVINGMRFENIYHQKDIVNHSKNIIDLIEIGDYVNGYRILAMEDSIYENSKRVLIYKNQKERYERWIYIQECDGKIHTQDDIVEILTKEKYEREVFKIE